MRVTPKIVEQYVHPLIKEEAQDKETTDFEIVGENKYRIIYKIGNTVTEQYSMEILDGDLQVRPLRERHNTNEKPNIRNQLSIAMRRINARLQDLKKRSQEVINKNIFESRI